MGFTANVVDGNVILASWGNEVRDRSCQVFATPAERDAQWASPPDGAICVTLDTHKVWQRFGSVWAPVSAGGIVTQAGWYVGATQVGAQGSWDIYIADNANAVGTRPYPVVVEWSLAINFGFAGGQASANANILRNDTSARQNLSEGPVVAGPGQWAFIAGAGLNTVAAGADWRFRITLTLTVAQAQFYATSGRYTVRPA